MAKLKKQTEERHSESRMREIRKSGSMRGSSAAATPPVAPYSTRRTWFDRIEYSCIGCADKVSKPVRKSWDRFRNAKDVIADISDIIDGVTPEEFDRAAEGYEDAAKVHPDRDNRTNIQRAKWARIMAELARRKIPTPR